MKHCYYFIIFLFTTNVFAQSLPMQNGTFTRCAPDQFFDSGGEFGPYGSNENFVTTICPSEAGEFIILDFISFSTQLNLDAMTLYDGDDITAPVIGTYSGANSPQQVVASETNTSGCITIQWVSNGTGTTTGWVADIFCAVPCQDITPFIESTTPEANSAGVVQILVGETVSFTGNSNFSDDGTGATYKWNFGGGTTDVALGQTVTKTFPTMGEYTVTLIVTDDNPLGCSATATIQVYVVGANIVVDTSAFTIEQLVQDVLIDSPCAAVSNITSSTGTNFGSVNGIGYFVNDGTQFPFRDGILLSSGNASEARGPNNNAMSAGGGGWPGDPQLASTVGIVSNNASIIEFDFVPLADSISFDFLMASEEYDEGSFECTYSDAFAFLLTDSNGNTSNLAVLPGTSTPILVTNIHPFNGSCPAINENYFGEYVSNNASPMSFDGRTAVFTAQSAVIPGENYHIKLVISDATDTALDSGVFLKAGSFNLGGNLGDDITIEAGTATCGGTDVVLDTNVPTGTHTWFQDGVEIEGETNSTLNVTEPGTYAVDVFFTDDCQFSSSIIVEFKPSPTANTAEDLSICINETAGDFNLIDNDDNILGAQDPDDYVITYHLTEQDAFDHVAPLTSPYTNISNPQTIYARIAESSQECYDTTSFEIGYTSLDINNAVTALEVCDDNADGFALFNLTDKDAEVIGDLDATTVSVTYHVSQADADSGSGALTSPYTNVEADNQTIFANVVTIGDAGCYNTTPLELVVNPLPVPVDPTPLKVCDDNTDGIANFDLDLKTAEILGSQTNISVSYHEFQEDANSGDNPQSSPYTSSSPSVQTIYVRLEDENTGCFNTTELTLIVEELPTSAEISDYQLCDNNMPGDETETFDLSTKTNEIINDQVNVTVTYHLNLEDAELGAAPLPNAYSNISNPQTIFYNITNSNTLCSNTGSLNLVVNALPTIFPPTPLEVCDDGTADGITQIDLSVKSAEVTGNNGGYTVSYHLTQADAESGAAPLGIPYTNESNGQLVYVRVQDSATGCHATTELELAVQQAPVANAPSPLEYCDPDSDGFGVFDLTVRDAEITGGDPALEVTYHETVADAMSGANPVAAPGSYNNIVLNAQTLYARVESGTIATDCATTVALQLIVNPTPQLAGATGALSICDDASADGIGQFDLTLAQDDILSALADPSLYTLSYYLDQSEAQVPENAIGTPTNFTNTVAPGQTIWVRVQDIATGCYKLSSIDLVVDALPVLSQPAPLELCDVNAPGDESEAFDLGAAQGGILGGQTGITLTYHESQADADAGTAAVSLPYTNTENAQTVFVRGTRNTTGCYSTVTLLLRVNPVPSPTAPSALGSCDADNDGFASFDLESRTDQIIGGELDVAVSYHETLEDAQMGDNALSSPYTNIVMGEQGIFVRLTNTVTGCYSTTETLSLVALPSPEVPTALLDYVVCDTNADGLAQFDLSTKDMEILGAQSPAADLDLVLTYHTTPMGAQTGSDPIANVSAFANTSNPQEIYVRLSSGSNGCVDTGSFEIRVDLPPEAVLPTPLELCDDEVADEATVFDLRARDSEITGGQGSWSVDYYETLAGAQSQQGAVDAQAYTNTSVGGAPANPQTLYAVVTDTDTGCTDITTLTLRVLPRPTPTTVLPGLVLCDDTDTGDLEEAFDLTQNEILLLNGEDGVTPTYHVTQQGALSNTAAIVDPTAYENTQTPQTIYVRVTNDITGCFTIVDFTLRVDPLPEAVSVSDYILCELDSDGIAQFDLTTRDSEALGGQDPGGFTVSYHASQADADALVGALVSPFANATNPQTIYVAITNNATGCSVSTPSFGIEVQEGARANADQEAILYETCGEAMDTDADPTNDSAQFDLSTQDPEVLDGQGAMDYSVSYYVDQAAAELGEDPLPLLYENLVNPQVIWARVDNDTPAGDGTDSSVCYEVAALTLQVNPLPVFDLGESYTLCVDGNGTEVLGSPVLDTGLGSPEYAFAWTLDGAPIPGADQGSHTAAQSGTYTVTVSAVSATGATTCASTDSTEVVESAPPLVVATVVTQAFAGAHAIAVSAEGIGDYEYSLDGGPWQDGALFAGVSLGEHRVTVRDRNGCGTAGDTVMVVDYPTYFTPNGDGYNDTWNIVGIDGLESAKIFIFDRYGKLLKQISPGGAGWNGTYNGSQMPTSDYWFVVEYQGQDPQQTAQKEFKAHFTLKR